MVSTAAPVRLRNAAAAIQCCAVLCRSPQSISCSTNQMVLQQPSAVLCCFVLCRSPQSISCCSMSQGCCSSSLASHSASCRHPLHLQCMRQSWTCTHGSLQQQQQWWYPGPR
jgi:hypothetical protein